MLLANYTGFLLSKLKIWISQITDFHFVHIILPSSYCTFYKNVQRFKSLELFIYSGRKRSTDNKESSTLVNFAFCTKKISSGFESKQDNQKDTRDRRTTISIDNRSKAVILISSYTLKVTLDRSFLSTIQFHISRFIFLL